MNSPAFFLGGARSSLVVFFFLVLTGISAFAQAGRGSISGTVSDPGGAVLSGAAVTLTNTATGVTQHTVTSAAGLPFKCCK